MTQTVSKCHICQSVFGDWPEFNMHHKSMHGLFAVKPENVTGRTPAEIVSDAETGWLRPHLVVTEPFVIQAHHEACRCATCFDRRLDALVDKTETTLKEIGG